MPIETIKLLTICLATGTEAVAGVVIAIAVIESAVRTVLVFLDFSDADDADRSHQAKDGTTRSVFGIRTSRLLGSRSILASAMSRNGRPGLVGIAPDFQVLTGWTRRLPVL